MNKIEQTIEKTRDYFRNPDKYRTRNAEILDRVINGGELQTEVAKDLGVTRQRVHSIVKRERARRKNG